MGTFGTGCRRQAFKWIPPEGEGWGGGGVLLDKGIVFPPFWSENGFGLCPFWSGIGYGFQGNYGSVRTYLLFQFQINE